MNVIKELMNGLQSRKASVDKSTWGFSLGVQQMYAAARESHYNSPWFGNKPGILESWAYKEWAMSYCQDYEGEYNYEEYDEK